MSKFQTVYSLQGALNVKTDSALRDFFWLLSHVIYLKLTRVLQEGLKSNQFSQFFLVRGKSEWIDKIYFAESSDISYSETEKEVLLPITHLWEKRHFYNTLVSLR